MLVTICKNCGISFGTYKSRKKTGRGLYCTKKCMYESMLGKKPWNTGKKCLSLSTAKTGSKNPMWKGGMDKKESDKNYARSERGKKVHALANKKYMMKKEAKEKTNLRSRNRLKDNVHHRIKRNISNGIWCKLKRRKLKKDGFIIDCLPYTIEELKNHLEKLFKSGMNWDNYGKWHIDHVIPDIYFNYISTKDVEFKKSWDLNNLQPLWARDNIKKGCRINK
jgi:hypothetical protein